ncbi:brain protein I3 [Colletes gigas]|uniref:brain protein I3 n=1 Tax=Colletes gigas TaxID=935657 RepID=UPI001C9B8966|nr:brain protein I3 [Colletes gigas]
MENQPLNQGTDKPPLYSEVFSETTITSKPPSEYSSTQGRGILPPGYYPSAPGTNTSNYVTSYGSTQSTTVTIPETILVGVCPACRMGIMENDYTCLGLLCAIMFFPIGILCCLMLKTRRCSNCGVYFD